MKNCKNCVHSRLVSYTNEFYLTCDNEAVAISLNNIMMSRHNFPDYLIYDLIIPEICINWSSPDFVCKEWT